MKKLTALTTIAALLLFVGCSLQPAGNATSPTAGFPSSTFQPTATQGQLDNYKFPGDAAKGLLAQFAPLIPNEIFTTTGEENGLIGTMYTAIGSVERYIEEPDGYPVFIEIRTLEGNIVVMDPVEMLRSQPETNTMLSGAGLNRLREYYPLPEIGSFVSIIVEYQGMSGTFDCPFFMYGTTDYMLETMMEVAMLGGDYAKEADYDAPTRPAEITQPATEPTKPDSSDKTPTEANPSTSTPTKPNSHTEPSNDTVPAGNSTAVKAAKNYLRIKAFSRNGLIEQLEYEGYSKADATYAADNCDADWNDQAVKAGKKYLEIKAFSYTGLIDQLKYEGFTATQATHGADNTGANWDEQAKKSAASYLSIKSFTRKELIAQLEYEGFTHAQAVYGVDANGL